MVQNNSDDKFAGTYRKLFDTIERGADQCSTDKLQTLLEEKKGSLKLGLEAFGDPSSQSRQKITSGTSVTVDGKTIKLEQSDKDLILKLSDVLKLNELECASLWDTYKQSNNTSSDLPPSENLQLIVNVITSYHEDRLSLLGCISSLQRISLDKQHPYTSIAHDTITKLYQGEEAGTTFIQRLFSQYSKLVRNNAPSRTITFPGWTLTWAKQNLKEQKALLEIVFLFALSESLSPEFTFSVIQEFEADCFGRLQAFSYVLDEEGIALRDKVTCICMILSVNLVVPPTLTVDVKLNPANVNQTLLDTPDIIAKINQTAAYLGDQPEHSIFLLAWSFFLTCVDAAISYENVPASYTQIVSPILEGKQTISSSVLIDRPLAEGTDFDDSKNRAVSIKQGANLDRIYLGRSLKLNVFDAATQVLQSEVCSEEDVNSFGYRSVLRDVFRSFLSVTRPYYIPMDSYASLINSYCLIYKNQPELCDSFWTEDFDSKNPFSLLATARSRFPVFFSDFTQMLSALTGAPTENNSTITGSAVKVFKYFSSIPTITVVLSPSIESTANDEDGEVVIRNSQAIQVTPELDFVQSISIPANTRGLLVSTSEDNRVVQYPVEYSGWHMLIAILSGFVSMNSGPIDVQDPEQNLIGKNSDTIVNILDLIHSVLLTDPKLTTTLVQHIDNVAGNASAETPLLISVLYSILSCTSTMKPCPIPILTLTVKCLTLLMPHYRNQVWSLLKFAPILPTTNTGLHTGLASFSHKQSASAQIQEIVSKVECTTGRYSLLLAFLDLVKGLVQDVQRSWWVSDSVDNASIPNRQYQVEVLYICLHYLMSDVFPSYAHWRYKKLSERYLIGTKVLSIFTDVAHGFKESESSSTKLSLSGIREGIFNNFLYEGGVYHISPLVDTISEGAKTADLLYKSNFPKEAQRIEKLTEMTFVFVKILLQYRLEQINQGSPLTDTTLERLLLERTTNSTASSDFLHRVAKHINYRHNIILPIQATNVLTLLCRTTSAWKTVPNFVQYLGSTDQIHAVIRTYLDIAKDQFQNEALLTSIWQLLTVLLETQPSLAILFLDCGDFIMPSPKSAVRLLSGETRPAQAPAAPTTESAIRAATDILSFWETLSVEKPSVMSNVLRFLSVFWKTAFDHYALVERARCDNALWDGLGKVLLNPSSEVDASGRHIQSLELLTADEKEPRHDVNVRRLCCLNLSKAFVMRIIAYEIHLTAGNIHGRSDALSDKLPAGLKNLLSKISEPSKLSLMRTSFTKNDFSPSVVLEVETSAEVLLQTIGVQNTSALLLKTSRVGSGDDGAAGEASQYGDNFLYDYDMASSRIHTLYKDVVSKYDFINQKNLIVTPEVQAVLDLKQYANHFLQSLLLANYNSSVVDSQVILLRSFTTFMETASRRASDLIWVNKSGVTGTETLISFLKSITDTAQQEKREDGVTLTSYSLLIQFVRSLTEDWISQNSTVITGSDEAAQKNYITKTYDLLSSLCALLNRENYSLFNSICDQTAIRFHRPLLESIMLCLRTMSGTASHFALLSEEHLKLNECLATLLSVVCSSLHILVIKATSYSALGSAVSDELSEGCIKDTVVVVSLLQELVSPKYKLSEDIWLEAFDKSETIPSLLQLLYRGIELLVKELDSQSANLNGAYNISVTPYAETALYFLLQLSNIPKAADKLVKHNIFDSLCNNNLTPRLQQGTLDVFVRFGDNKNGPNYMERNPLHLIWCLVLGVVNNLMRTMGNSEVVLQYTVNLMQMYGPQIGTAFNNANGAKDTIFGLSASESLATPLLEEIQRINMIFFELSKYLTRIPNIANNLFVSFKDCSLFLLQRYLYLYTHPSHMQAQLYPIDNVERQQAQTFISDDTADVKTRTSKLMRKTIVSTLIIAHYMLSTLISLTNADTVLTASDVEWPYGNTIIYPDLRVTVGETTSFGTLIECINICIVMLGQWQDEKDAPLQHLLHVIQDCALLLTAQTALWVAKPDIKDETRMEIAQETILDVAETLNKVHTSLTKLQEARKDQSLKSKLGLICLLQSFLGDRYFEK